MVIDEAAAANHVAHGKVESICYLPIAQKVHKTKHFLTKVRF